MDPNPAYIPRGLERADPLTPEAVAALGQGLRERAAPARSLDEVRAAIGPLARVARRWLDPGDPLRIEALGRLPDASPFGPEMWADALDLLFAPITADALARFVADDLGESGPVEFARLIGQVLAGNVPAPAVQAMFAASLAGSAQLVKTSAEDRLFPVLLARSLAEESPALADRVAVVHWPGGSTAHNAALAHTADRLVAFGQADSMHAWRALASAEGVGLIEHGPRTSIALLELAEEDPSAAADGVARDVAMYDQQGCLSPQQLYLAGPIERARAFAERLAEALSRLAAQWPLSGRRPFAQRLAIRRARESLRMRRVLHRLNEAGGPAPWLDPPTDASDDRFEFTLIPTAGCSPQIGPGGRTVFVTRVEAAAEAIEAIAPAADMIQGAAVAERDEGRPLARRLRDELGIPYVCRPGELQRPPIGWHNDGIAPLGSLLG